jgi:hypothetical protein
MGGMGYCWVPHHTTHLPLSSANAHVLPPYACTPLHARAHICACTLCMLQLRRAALPRGSARLQRRQAHFER